MTATVVEGHQVVSDEPCPSPISTPEKPVLWKQTRKLTLDNGEVVFGCVHCEFVSENPHRIRPHLRLHKNGHKVTASKPGKTSLAALAREIERLEVDRDHWRERARKAERSLSAMRKALGVVEVPG